MIGPREQAARILSDRTTRGTSLDRLFQLPSFEELSSRDQRLTRELVQGVFRNLSLLDYFIACRSHRPLEKIDRIILWILRVSIYQIEFMRIPDYASLHEAGRLCRRLRKSSAQAFVNGILRGLLRERPLPPDGSSPKALSIRYSHPEWLVRRYLTRYGVELTEKLLKRNNKLPESVLWVNPFKTNVPDFLRELTEEGIGCEVLDDLPHAVRLRAKGFSEHRLYRQGYCFFMDASSQRVAQLCNLKERRLVGDLCAAPGGKTFILAGRAEPGTRILCSDLDFARLNQVRKRAEHYGISGLFFVQMDLTQPAACSRCFQTLLLDVPCSGTGTFRSNPDARWRTEERDLKEFHNRQILLLRNAFSVLLPGGDLIYSTCSTEPEENEDVVEEFLLCEKSSELLGDYFRTFPTQQEGDGFFAARVRRL